MIESLIELKELSDKEKEIPVELLHQFQIDDKLEPVEIRKQILKVFENNREYIIKDLSELTVQIMNLMQNFKTSANKFVTGGYKNSGKNARLSLNGLSNLKREFNRKSLLLS